MAKKDVNLRGVQLQMEYEEMKIVANELQKEFKAGNVNEEQYLDALREVEIIKTNYLNWVDFVAILNKPRDSRNKRADVYKDLYDSTTGLARESLLDESKNALADLKSILKNVKEFEEAHKDALNKIK